MKIVTKNKNGKSKKTYWVLFGKPRTLHGQQYSQKRGIGLYVNVLFTRNGIQQKPTQPLIKKARPWARKLAKFYANEKKCTLKGKGGFMSGRTYFYFTIQK